MKAGTLNNVREASLSLSNLEDYTKFGERILDTPKVGTNLR